MPNNQSIAYLCDINLKSDSHQDLVRFLQELPLDGTCKLEVTHASYIDKQAGPLTSPVMTGWNIKVWFRTLHAKDWKSATYDACERMARETLDKPAEGWTADLFTPSPEQSSKGGATTWAQMMFKQQDASH